MSAPVVLNVNDSASNRYYVTRVLKSAGFVVLEAETGGQGLALAREHKPNLVVLDIELPDISGLEVCRTLKTEPETSSILVIQTSATFVTSEGKARGLESGADQYLTQPFESIELVAMVRGLLKMHEKEVEAREKAEALSEADRRKDEFLAMLAHELRNPLSAVMTAASLLDDLELPPQGHRLTATITRQTRHLARLVDDLLDVSRITQGKIQLRKQPLDLGELLRGFIKGDEATTHKNHRLTLHIAEEPMWIDADPTRIEQILVNLVSNAAKYSAAGGLITVSLTPGTLAGRPSTTLKIRDTGIGLDKKDITSIFDLFFQVDHSLARTEGGLGIGLTMVKRLVELHGGTISVTSEGLGLGAEFRIDLPTIAEGTATSISRKSESAERAVSVLLVDDNLDSCELFSIALEQHGHQVVCANDGKQGLLKALEGEFQIAFIDIGLPLLDGYGVARGIKEGRGEDAPVLVALTGYGRDTDRQRALDAGFDEHLVKPVDVLELHRVIGRLLGGRGVRGRERSA